MEFPRFATNQFRMGNWDCVVKDSCYAHPVFTGMRNHSKQLRTVNNFGKKKPCSSDFIWPPMSFTEIIDSQPPVTVSIQRNKCFAPAGPSDRLKIHACLT